MSTNRLFSAVALLCLLSFPVQAAGIISLSDAFTDDASTGISTDNIYMHAISGGQAVAVNGVNFSLLNPTTTPANFNWAVASGIKNQIPSNNGDWMPATGGVTGPGIQSLLNGFAYNSGAGAAEAGGSQTYTLSGLTPGQRYDTRLYIRTWDTDGVRDIDFTFTNGTDVDTLLELIEDQPEQEGFPSVHSAYYLSYEFIAQGTDLVIDAAVGSDSGTTGSFHLYGLSNQVVVPEPASLALWSILGLGLVGFGWMRRR